MKIKLQKITYWASVSVIGIIIGISLQFAKAWSEPSATAPNGNLGAPINTGGAAQGRLGNLGIGTTNPLSKLSVGGGGGSGTGISVANFSTGIESVGTTTGVFAIGRYYGVYGIGQATNGTGVVGYGKGTGAGVYASGGSIGGNFYGVNYGVYASGGAYGVQTYGGTYGIDASSNNIGINVSGVNYGVYSRAIGGLTATGVYGFGSTHGVYGHTIYLGGYGVTGVSTSYNGTGVSGSGGAFGVEGYSRNATGVYGFGGTYGGNFYGLVAGITTKSCTGCSVLAEMVPVAEIPNNGDIMCTNSDNGKTEICRKDKSSRVKGIAQKNAEQIMRMGCSSTFDKKNGKNEMHIGVMNTDAWKENPECQGWYPIALSGLSEETNVVCKTPSGKSLKYGDILVTSDMPGHLRPLDEGEDALSYQVAGKVDSVCTSNKETDSIQVWIQ